MARTPILSELEALARRVRAAQAAGLPPEAACELPRITRRELVRSLGVVAAGALLLPIGCKSSRKSGGQQPKVAVVGAGLAGLVAASRLGERGIAAQIFEATGRAGGRVHTDRSSFAEGQRVERGGELIDSGHERLRELITRLGLVRDDLREDEPLGTDFLAHVGGRIYTRSEAAADFARLFPTLQRDTSDPDADAKLDRMSVEEWIASRVDGGMSSRLGRLLAIAYDIEYGAPIGDQSALDLTSLLGTVAKPDEFELFGESDERFRVRGGNDQVPARLAEALAEQIELKHVLVAARTLEDGRVRLVFDTPGGTRELEFERVVMTLPFAVLRTSVDFYALNLQPEKRAAIHEIGMGTNAKLHVQFVDRAWHAARCNGATYSDRGYQSTWDETRGQQGASGILVNFRGSSGASLAGAKPESAAATFLAGLEPVLPGSTSRWSGRATIDCWPTSPWQRGSYSYWRVGQSTRFADVVAKPEGNVFFAGEHTSSVAQGFMEGAVESGERAADELLASL